MVIKGSWVRGLVIEEGNWKRILRNGGKGIVGKRKSNKRKWSEVKDCGLSKGEEELK